jgi:hypothetical protein
MVLSCAVKLVLSRWLFLERSVPQRQQPVAEEARTRNKIRLEEVNGVGQKVKKELTTFASVLLCWIQLSDRLCC